MDYEANDLSRALLTSDATPLVITRVCMLWQHIALRTPFLWAHLSLRPCRGRTHYRLAHLFIERAMGHDLYVHYDEDAQRGSLSSENCPCALDIISQNIEQIKTLELVKISEESLARFVTSVSRAAASGSPLTRFEVSTQFDYPASTTILRALPNICNAPNVRDIQWSGAVFPEDVVPWQQIVCLRLSGCLLSPRQVLRSIVNAPVLRDFSACVTEAEVRNGRLVQYAAVHTETLESLALDCDGALDVLFRSLHVPRLRSLQLRPLPSMSTWAPHGSDWPFRDINVLHTFLGRLQDGLEHFLLFDGGNTFDESALLRIIEMPQASSLVDLHVSQVSGCVGDAVFVKLTPRRGAVPLLPHLERLSMSACSTSLNTISRMLDARRLLDYPLREIALGHARGNLSPLDYRS
ncbi:hypothetical protein EV121DRAFT_279767 [Schizophyllum commune]